MALVKSQSSNVVGTRYAWESSIGVLPGSPVWKQLEPNSFNDFGGDLKKVAREPLSANRQRKKGAVVDLDAAGGINSDLTQENMVDLLQGFMFANVREKYESAGVNNLTPVSDISVTATNYASANFGISGNVLANHIIFGRNFLVPGNNGLHVVTSITGNTTITAPGLAVESTNSAARLTVVGYQFATGTLDANFTSGAFPALDRASGAFDFTTLGLIPGEWVYVGGDAAGEKFTDANINGWARVRSVTATKITFDKTQFVWTADEVGTGKTIRIFFGTVLKNEVTSSLIVKRSLQVERTLGAPDDALPAQVQAEYIEGALGNEFKLNMPTADKMTVDLGFIATDFTQRDSVTGVKSGSRPSIAEADLFNTSSDVKRAKLALVSSTDACPTAQFAYATQVDITINNNLKPLKAISKLGAFDVNAGTFEVSGNLEVYFTTVAAVQAIRNNSDVTLDFVLAKQNAGMVVDMPLVSLGGGRADIQKDEPIKLPLALDAATAAKVAATLDYTLLLNFFAYLPNAAMV